jgi:hypothetical protein
LHDELELGEFLSDCHCDVALIATHLESSLVLF